MKVGFFDSGIGGLSVLHIAWRRFSDLEYIYYADKKHVPYGEKRREEIVGYVDEIIASSWIKTLTGVIACNTATSAAVGAMREKYSVPIIGMEPAVKKAIDTYGAERCWSPPPETVNGDKLHACSKDLTRTI
jgi:glutamate racemase